MADRQTFPAEGWYWVPPRDTISRFLARDVFDAYHRLMCLIEAADQAEEAPDEAQRALV